MATQAVLDAKKKRDEQQKAYKSGVPSSTMTPVQGLKPTTPEGIANSQARGYATLEDVGAAAPKSGMPTRAPAAGTEWAQNPQTGKWVERPLPKDTDVKPPVVETDSIRATADIPYLEASELGEDMFGEKNPYKGKEGFSGAVLEEYEKQRAEDKKYLEEQQAREKQLQEEELRKTAGGLQDIKSTVVGTFAQGREGVVSTGRPKAIEKYSDSLTRELQSATTRFDSAQAARDRAMVELERATVEGRKDLIELRQTQLAQAEQKLNEANIAKLDAEARGADLALKLNQEQRAAVTSFTELIQTGATLTPDSILAFSQQYNVPFEAAFSYYQGMEFIREDKKLSLEEKAIATEQLNQELQNTLTGGALETQRKVDYFTELVRSGLYDQDQLQSLSVAMGLDNQYNPLSQAEIKLNAANAALKAYEASYAGGVPPVGSVEYYEYLKTKAEASEALATLQGLSGTTGGAYVPAGTPKEGIQVSYNNGIFNVMSPPDKIFSCGAGVNRALGTSFGDEYSQKAGIVQEAINNGTGVAGADAALNPNLIKAGMIFVMPTSGNSAQWGHVGIVKSVDPLTGKFTAYEWNRDGAFRGSGVVEGPSNFTSNGQYNINQMYGFMQPPNAKLEGDLGGATTWTPAQVLEFNKAQNYANSNVPTGQEAAFNAFIAKKADKSTPLEELLPLTIGGKGFDSAEDKTISALSDTKAGLADLEELLSSTKTDKLNPLIGVLRSANPWDTKAQAIQRLIDSLTPGAARGIYGEVGVLTDADIARYQRLFPSIKDTKDVQDIVFDMMNRTIQRKAESTIRTMAASGVNVSGLEYLIPDLIGEQKEETDDIYAIYDNIEKTYEANRKKTIQEDDLSDIDSIWNE